jgi:hypothetical protein
MVFDTDYDILNQGSIDYIKQYFDQKQQYDMMQTMNDTNLHIKKNDQSAFSVNSIGFSISLIILFLFIMILWNFIYNKNT